MEPLSALRLSVNQLTAALTYARHGCHYKFSCSSCNWRRRRVSVRPACGTVMACPSILRINPRDRYKRTGGCCWRVHWLPDRRASRARRRDSYIGNCRGAPGGLGGGSVGGG